MDQKGPNEFRTVASPDMFAEIDANNAGYAMLDVDAHPLAYEVQDALADLLDIPEVFIKGGAVRNRLTGMPIDEIDTIFDIRQSGLLSEDDFEEDKVMDTLEYIARIINLSEDFDDCKIVFFGEVDGVPTLNILATYKGMEVDIHPKVHDVDVYNCVYETSDAPILSACMDMNGDCWAQPEFPEHLKHGIIATDSYYHQNKFRRPGDKCDRYGWKVMGTQEAKDFLAEMAGNKQKYEI